MWISGLTLIVILALAVLALLALRRQGPTPVWLERLDGEGPEAVLARLRHRVEELRGMPSLFRDEDYRWLRERGFPEAARRLRRQRVELARRYLAELRELFEQVHALHAHLAAAVEPDLTASAALRFRLRWTGARLMLPLSLFRLNLGPLEALGQALAGSFAGLEQQASAAAVGI